MIKENAFDKDIVIRYMKLQYYLMQIWSERKESYYEEIKIFDAVIDCSICFFFCRMWNRR